MIAAPSVAPALPVEAPSTPAGWRRAASHDLEAIRSAVLADSPAIQFRKEGAAYRRWLKRGYAEARRGLNQVSNQTSYWYLLQGFVGGFRDSHVAVFPRAPLPKPKPETWPGFATVWRDGKYRVTSAARFEFHAPPAGAELIGCEGAAAASIAEMRLDRYAGDLRLDAGKFASAATLLWDGGNPFVPPPPRTCRFRVAGKIRTYRLRQRPAQTPEASASAQAAVSAVHARTDVQTWGSPRRWWLGMAQMMPYENWSAFFSKVEEHLGEIRAADDVVIDVRGNGGGSSAYPTRLARMLWGDALVSARRPRLGDLDWRVSADNRRFLTEQLARAEADPSDGSSLAQAKDTLRIFDAAAARGDELAHFSYARPAAPAAVADNPVRGRVIVLTDHTCNSACLDLMDLFLAMPRVCQAGVTTTADTVFMEFTYLDLPSGITRLGVGHKAWPQRLRRSNLPYAPPPDLTYHGGLNDDPAVRAWLDDVLSRNAVGAHCAGTVGQISSGDGGSTGQTSGRAADAGVHERRGARVSRVDAAA